MEFAGKRVLITGGGGGLGLEIGKKFLSEKATVILLDKNEKILKEVKEAIPEVITICVDLLDWTATKLALEGVGHVDHVVNNAGVGEFHNFLDVTPESLEFVFGVNFKAIVNVSQVFAKKMLAKGTGATIVNISSIAAKNVFPSVSMYSASKAALLMLTKSMAVELGPTIRVNSVCPTFMLTPLTQDHLKANPEQVEPIINRQTIRRFAELAETADAVIFLSSSKSSMITGSSLDVDGGYLVG